MTTQDPEVEALIRAFDESGVKYHNRAEALAKLKEGREIVFTEDGPTIHYDGETLHLREALQRFGRDTRTAPPSTRSKPSDPVGSSRI